MLGISNADKDGYVDQAKPKIKALIGNQLKEMVSTKVIMTLQVNWKKPVKSDITLDPKDLEHDEDIGGNTEDNYIMIEVPFNSLIHSFLKVSLYKS